MGREKPDTISLHRKYLAHSITITEQNMTNYNLNL